MRDLFHKIASISMALLLLLSTVSWKVEKHYCMGRLMNVALFTDVASCGMNMASTMAAEEDRKETDNGCCEDEVVIVDGQDNLKISLNDLEVGQQNFLFAFTHSYIQLLHDVTEQPVPHEHYPPPNLVKNIQLLDEVFLI